MLHALEILLMLRLSFNDIVRKINQELGEASLGGCVVAEDRGEGSIPKRLRETLAQGLASTSVVTQASAMVRQLPRPPSRLLAALLPGGSSVRRA